MPEELTPPSDADERIRRALEPAVPQLYINGFVSAMNSGDVMVVLERNGSPAAVLNVSFTVAKTLALSLSQLVAQLEVASGKTMLTTHEMEAALRRQQTQPERH